MNALVSLVSGLTTAETAPARRAPAEEDVMDFEAPLFEEIKMDAEAKSYVDDLARPDESVTPSVPDDER